MADDNERFRLQMTWLRDEEVNLTATELRNEDDESEDVNGVNYYSDLETGLPNEAILVLAATDVHNSKLRRIKLTFDEFHIVLKRTDEPATLGDRAAAGQEQRQRASPPTVASELPPRWH